MTNRQTILEAIPGALLRTDLPGIADRNPGMDLVDNEATEANNAGECQEFPDCSLFSLISASLRTLPWCFWRDLSLTVGKRE